jgi:alcohol dehydrogenase, propanol-preferring
MKAARFFGAGTPLKIMDVEVPQISNKEVLVKVKAAGVCHTDLHFLDGTLKPWKGSLPMTLGHEISGEVVETGKGVKTFRKQDHVVLNNGISCGKCIYCKSGRENLCNDLDQLGFTLDGGYAEYVKAPQAALVKLPKNIDYDEGSLLPCGVAACYHAMFDIANLKRGETLLVNGSGGLGLSAIQLANTVGAKTIAVDVVDEKLETARKLGAEVVNANNQNVPESVKKITGGQGVDVALELVGASATMRNALSSLRKTGRYAILGYTKDILETNVLNLVIAETEIRGVVAYTKKDLLAVVRLAQQRKLKPIIGHKYGLEEINSALDSLRHGTIQGRSIIVP